MTIGGVFALVGLVCGVLLIAGGLVLVAYVTGAKKGGEK
jgi:hypothetical protein